MAPIHREYYRSIRACFKPVFRIHGPISLSMALFPYMYTRIFVLFYFSFYVLWLSFSAYLSMAFFLWHSLCDFYFFSLLVFLSLYCIIKAVCLCLFSFNVSLSFFLCLFFSVNTSVFVFVCQSCSVIFLCLPYIFHCRGYSWVTI